MDLADFIKLPYQHQLEGVEALLSHPNFAIFDEAGAGKTKQVVDSACLLYREGKVDTVVVVCPAQVKPVWLDPDPELGEVAKHSFVPYYLHEYSSRKTQIYRPPSPDQSGEGGLLWVVCSYDFLRRRTGKKFTFAELLAQQLRGRHVLLVVDESGNVKNHRSLQTRAVFRLKQLACQRAVLLDGTPQTQSPADLYSQFAILDKRILGCQNFYEFRAKYCKMGGFMMKNVVGFKNEEEFQGRIRPYILRREKRDCLDLPEKSYSFLTTQLEATTWQVYVQMREELLVRLKEEVSLAQNGAIKSLRLAQITAGFLGGVLSDEDPEPSVVELSREKLQLLHRHLRDQLERDPNYRALVWMRFTPELERAHALLQDLRVPLYLLRGGQSERARRAALWEGKQGEGPVVILGQPQAASQGLTFTSLHHVIYASCDFNLRTRLQSEDRVHRPGQRHPVYYLDLLATGPSGQKTIDHKIVKALRQKEDVAQWSYDRWRKELTEE